MASRLQSRDVARLLLSACFVGFVQYLGFAPAHAAIGCQSGDPYDKHFTGRGFHTSYQIRGAQADINFGEPLSVLEVKLASQLGQWLAETPTTDSSMPKLVTSTSTVRHLLPSSGSI